MNKDEAREWVKANISRSEDEVLAAVSSMTDSGVAAKNAARDVRIVIDYINHKDTRCIAAEQGVTSERIRQIVRRALRYIIYHMVRFEYAGDYKLFYRDFPLVSPSAYLSWGRKEPKKILARLKYIVFEHAGRR